MGNLKIGQDFLDIQYDTWASRMDTCEVKPRLPTSLMPPQVHSNCVFLIISFSFRFTDLLIMFSMSMRGSGKPHMLVQAEIITYCMSNKSCPILDCELLLSCN